MGRRSTADGGRPRRALARGAAWTASERPSAVPAPAIALSCSAQPLTLVEDDRPDTIRHEDTVPQKPMNYLLRDPHGEDVGTVSVASEGAPLLEAEGAGLALDRQSPEWRIEVALERPALRLTLQIHGIDLVLPEGTDTGHGGAVTVAVDGGSASIIGEPVPTAARAAAGGGSRTVAGHPTDPHGSGHRVLAAGPARFCPGRQRALDPHHRPGGLLLRGQRAPHDPPRGFHRTVTTTAQRPAGPAPRAAARPAVSTRAASIGSAVMEKSSRRETWKTISRMSGIPSKEIRSDGSVIRIDDAKTSRDAAVHA